MIDKALDVRLRHTQPGRLSCGASEDDVFEHPCRMKAGTRLGHETGDCWMVTTLIERHVRILSGICQVFLFLSIWYVLDFFHGGTEVPSSPSQVRNVISPLYNLLL